LFKIFTLFGINSVCSRIAHRTSDTEPYTYAFYDWIIPCNNLVRNNLSDYYNSLPYITKDTDFNTLIKEGNYLNTNNNNPNIPFKSTGFLIVNTIYNKTDPNIWIYQNYTNITATLSAYRIFRCNPVTLKVVSSSDWVITNKFSNQGFGLKDKKIVNFGDSIFGNFQDNSSVSSIIANITSANVTNMGFGGCRMSNTDSSDFKYFSMVELVKAIISQDFTLQDNAIANSSNLPHYFASSLEKLKLIDFSKIDYITISYGTNDYTAGINLDNVNNLMDTSTWAGALRFSIENLLTAFPNLRILLGSPIWRCWLNQEKTEIVSTSDDRKFNGNFTLPDMVEKCKEIGKNYHIPVLDAYNNLSLNKFNYLSFFSNTDTTHPNVYGRACLGKEYAYKLCEI
jgi:hypothetical protein